MADEQITIEIAAPTTQVETVEQLADTTTVEVQPIVESTIDNAIKIADEIVKTDTVLDAIGILQSQIAQLTSEIVAMKKAAIVAEIVEEIEEEIEDSIETVEDELIEIPIENDNVTVTEIAPEPKQTRKRGYF